MATAPCAVVATGEVGSTATGLQQPSTVTPMGRHCDSSVFYDATTANGGGCVYSYVV